MYITIRYIIMIDIEIILSLTVAPDEFILDKFEKYMTYPHYPICSHHKRKTFWNVFNKLAIIINYLSITHI